MRRTWILSGACLHIIVFVNVCSNKFLGILERDKDRSNRVTFPQPASPGRPDNKESPVNNTVETLKKLLANQGTQAPKVTSGSSEERRWFPPYVVK